MKTGLAISTYFCEHTPSERFNIFRSSIESLLISGYDSTIVIVDDGSTTQKHLEGLDSRIGVVRRDHGGVARTKNTCIKELLARNVDVGFLADDDICYGGGWHVRYSDAVVKTGLDHFSFFLENTPCEFQELGGLTIRKTPSVNGCFLTFTKKLVDLIGFFKILPHDYGHEHSNFSLRAAVLAKQGGFYDICDSDRYIQIIPDSISNKSIGVVDSYKFKENEQHAILTEFKYEPFSE